MVWVAVGVSAVGVVSGIVSSNKAQKNADKANAIAQSSADTQNKIALDQWENYKTTYQPMEKAYALEAQNYDTPENRELAAGEASAIVSDQYGKARERLGRTPGLDPSSAAYTSAIVGLDMNQAATDAVSQNAARKKTADTAWARKTDALSIGKGLPAQASAGLAQSANFNSGMAMNAQNQANQSSAGIGSLVSSGLNAWNSRPQTPTQSTYQPTSLAALTHNDFAPMAGVGQIDFQMPRASNG